MFYNDEIQHEPRKHVEKGTKLISSKHVLLVINSLAGKNQITTFITLDVEKLKPM